MKPTAGALLFLALFLILCAVTLAKDIEEDELTVNDEGDEVVIKVKRAAAGKGKNKQKNKECRYVKGQWSDCNPSTNERTRTLTLKRGNKDECEPTRSITKKCKKEICRYAKGEWGPCNPSTNQMERTDTLKPGGDPSCPPTRKMPPRKCRTCKYDRKAEWSSCDPTTDMRTKVQKLLQGDPTLCEPSKTQTRACKTRTGKERCFYGSWSEWGKCENGTLKKTRPVLSGGPRCQKRAVKTKPCKGSRS